MIRLKLADGVTNVFFESVDIGSKGFMDNKEPIIDGDWIIEDGTTISTRGGVISSIKSKSNNRLMKFKADKDKQMIYGPFLIPNMLIYRRDEKNGEYYIRFSKEEIEKISSKFNSDLNMKNINMMHTDEMVDAFVAQNWIIEGENDKSKNLGFDLPEGTWFGAIKVRDSEVWNNKVKNDEVRGFSVEILADLQLSLSKNKNENMETIKLGSMMLNDGITPIFFDGEELSIGSLVFTDEAMTIPVESDRWVLQDGRTIVTGDGGVIESIEDVSQGESPIANEPPVQSQSASLSAAEVSQMIDARFADLMNEITALKGLIEPMKEENENHKKEISEYKSQIENFKSEINEKLASTPAVNSIKKDVYVPKIATDFENQLKRVKAFAGK